MKRFWLICCGILGFTGCVAVMQVGGPESMTPHLTDSGFVAADGVELPMRHWQPKDEKPWAVIVALHGMNDYSNAFDAFGKAASNMGVAVYAYDQRGFGSAPKPGIWAGWQTMVRDLRDVSVLLKGAYPGTPFYVLGDNLTMWMALFYPLLLSGTVNQWGCCSGPCCGWLGMWPPAGNWFRGG